MLAEGSFNWTAAGAWGAFLALLGIIVRQVGPWRKQSIDAERNFRDGLLARVELLELKIEHERARHAAEMGIARHRLNNITQCFDALLLLIETSPDKAAEAVRKVKDMRAAQLRAEAEERGAIRAADIQATAPEGEQ